MQTQPLSDPLDYSVREFLDVLAERRALPGAGSLAALAVAASAALVARGARYSTAVWPDADAAVAQAEALRQRVAPLALLDAEVFERALEALDEPREASSDRRDWSLGQALTQAAEVPLRIAGVGADVAALAAEVAERGSDVLRPDVAAAAALAEAGTRMAAHLVEINLGTSPGDSRVARATALSTAAAEAARRALTPP